MFHKTSHPVRSAPLRHDWATANHCHKFIEAPLGGNVDEEVLQMFVAQDEHLLNCGHTIDRSRKFSLSLTGKAQSEGVAATTRNKSRPARPAVTSKQKMHC